MQGDMQLIVRAYSEGALKHACCTFFYVLQYTCILASRLDKTIVPTRRQGRGGKFDKC
jgi:hypothetical protein